MKTLVIAFVFLSVFSCKKQDDEWITGTVGQDKGCFPNSWVVRLDEANYRKYSFLCNPSGASSSSWTNNCDNSVFILDLPAYLRQPGTRIKFSKWTDRGLLCFSSTFAPHHLEVQDVRAK
jgi:hypothetical protein